MLRTERKEPCFKVDTWKEYDACIRLRSHLDGCDDDEITYVLIKITTTKINRMTIMMMLITQRTPVHTFFKRKHSATVVRRRLNVA